MDIRGIGIPLMSSHESLLLTNKSHYGWIHLLNIFSAFYSEFFAVIYFAWLIHEIK